LRNDVVEFYDFVLKRTKGGQVEELLNILMSKYRDDLTEQVIQSYHY